MKRILRILSAMLLTACLLLPAQINRAARAEIYEAYYTGDMIVANCEEWVSLRSAPDSSASRLAKAPLGATVTDCSISGENSAYVSCCYDGEWGYILRDYLLRADYETGISMTVVNCNEWVTLRTMPSASSERILKVPLGAQVTNCVAVSEEYICCSYGGHTGYILTQYLSAAVDSATVPSKDALLNFGRSALEATCSGYTIIARRDYRDGGEILKAACYDATNREVWSYDTFTSYSTELDMTSAFIGGTAESPMVMIYNAETGLTALDLATGAEQWFLSSESIDLGASISTATGSDGTMYIGGYYGPDPVAIDLYGNVLWQAQPSVEAYWLHEIILNDTGVAAVYDSLVEHEHEGWICYDYATGAELHKGWQ